MPTRQYSFIVLFVIIVCSGCDFKNPFWKKSQSGENTSSEIEETDSSKVKVKKDPNNPADLSYEELTEKKAVLKKEYRAAKKKYKTASGEEKVKWKSEVKWLRKKGRAVVLELKKRDSELKGQRNVAILGKIKVLKEKLAIKQKEYKDLQEWKTKVGKMSRIASTNTCAWCGAKYGGSTTRLPGCPSCGKTAISPIMSERKSDVDLEIVAIHKKVKPLRRDINLLKIKIAILKTKLKK